MIPGLGLDSIGPRVYRQDMNTNHQPLPLVRLRATYDDVRWEDDSEDPIETGGFTDPSNPWGGFKQDRDDDSAEPDCLHLPLYEAAEFVNDFPGGVWDFREAEAERTFGEGDDLVWRRVMLHVDGPGTETVFAIAEVLA